MDDFITNMDSVWVAPPKELLVSGDHRRRSPASITLTWGMERSITTDCLALDCRIAKLLTTLASFVRHVREARSDVDAVSRELHSLQTVLNLLKEDAALFPPEFAEHTPILIEHCSYIIDQLDESVSILDGPGLSKQERRTQWLNVGRIEAASFRTTLEAHKAAIGLALDLVGAYVLLAIG